MSNKIGISLDDVHWLPLDKISQFVDWKTTEKVNSVSKYIAYNKFTPDDDITVEELKKFRTWLATQMLVLGDIEDADIKHILEYYATGMTDDVVEWLSKFGDTTLSLTSTATSGCGCSGNSGVSQSVLATTVKSSSCGCGTGNLSSLYLQNLSSCDPLFIYRKNIYLKMVDTFSNVDFWLQFEDRFLIEVRKYINNIIKMNFDLVKSTFTSDFTDCGCVNDSTAAQERQIARLRRLSQSLTYIIGEVDVDPDTEGINGHKTYIGTALNEFAVYLYEIMEWV